MPSLSTSSLSKQPMRFSAMYIKSVIEMIFNMRLVMSFSSHDAFRL